MLGSERVGAILAAAGSGARAGLAKQWLVLGGETVLARAARPLVAAGLLDELVAVVGAGEEARALAVLRPVVGDLPLRVVAGGAVRSQSVRNGLAALSAATSSSSTTPRGPSPRRPWPGRWQPPRRARGRRSPPCPPATP